jgi:hypothetical protein
MVQLHKNSCPKLQDPPQWLLALNGWFMDGTQQIGIATLKRKRKYIGKDLNFI